MEAYAIWNNKGGTGKSTITFHIATRFAEKHPQRKVLVVDLCPQANSSMMLLGGGQTGENELLTLCSQSNPKSVVGFLSECIANRIDANPAAYMSQISVLNTSVSPNLFLMCGDGNLELMASAINEEARRMPLLGLLDPWKWVHEVFKRMRGKLDGDDWTIFFDTNPSFSIYTELAICGATRLLVPINADDASRVAVKALFALLYGTNPPHPFFGNYTFAAQAKIRNMDIPTVHLAIGNRFTQFKGAAAAYKAFSDATADQLYNEFSINPQRFSTRTVAVASKPEFLGSYVGELRDFNTAGVVAAHHGNPLSKMRQDYYPVHGNNAVKANYEQIKQGRDAVDSVVNLLDP